MKLAKLLNEVIELSETKDVHLEHLYEHWAAATCHTDKVRGGKKQCSWHDSTWFEGKTPEEAVSKLLESLKKDV